MCLFICAEGAVKITPAHDHNDYAVGERHNLPYINMMDDNGLICDINDFLPQYKKFVVSFVLVFNKSFNRN